MNDEDWENGSSGDDKPIEKKKKVEKELWNDKKEPIAQD